jgi:hypothetical protein
VASVEDRVVLVNRTARKAAEKATVLEDVKLKVSSHNDETE